MRKAGRLWLRQRELSVAEVIGVYIERIGKFNPTLNAIVSVDALQAAAVADRLAAREETLYRPRGYLAVRDGTATSAGRLRSYHRRPGAGRGQELCSSLRFSAEQLLTQSPRAVP